MADVAVVAQRMLVRIGEEGLLTELRNLATRRNYLALGPQPLWKLVFRDEGCLENEIGAGGQSPRVRASRGGADVSYEELRWKGERLDIRFRFAVEASGADEVTWRFWVENRQPGIEITEVWFPCISGLRGIGGSYEKDALLFPIGTGMRVKSPLSTLGLGLEEPVGFHGYSFERRTRRALYPGLASMQCLFLGNEREGLYLGSHDASLQTTCLNVEKRYDGQGHLLLNFVKFPHLGPGEAYASEPFVVSAHRGDWHVGARKYRAWAERVHPLPDPPRWVRELEGWQLTILKHQFGQVYWRYDELPRLLEEARTGGLDCLFLFGWYQAGHDNRYPEYFADRAMGGEEGLKAGLKAVEAAGGKTILYIQGRLIDPAGEFYRSGPGRQVAMKTVWGTEYREGYPFSGAGVMTSVSNCKEFAVACASCAEWREVMTAEGEKVKALGASGIIYDQIGGNNAYLCYDPGHGHRRPALAHGPAMKRNVEFWRERLKRGSPDFAFTSEVLCDAFAGLFDVVHGAGPGFQPGPEDFPQLFRRVFPEIALSNRNQDREDYGMANFSVVHGYRFDVEILSDRGSLAASPGLAAYLKQVVEMRKRFPEVLLNGSYLDQEGFRLDSEHLQACAYASDQRRAVVIWNPTSRGRALELSLPRMKIEAILAPGREFSSLPKRLPAQSVVAVVLRAG